MNAVWEIPMVFPLSPRRIDYGGFFCGYRCQNSWDCKEFADSLYSGFPIRVKAFCYCGYISFLHPHPGVDILPSISVAVRREIFAMPNIQPCLYSERQICDYAVDEGAFAVRK